MVKRIATFQEFWTFYLGEHRHRVSRGLHAVGTAGFLIGLGAGLVFLPGRTGVALALLVVGAGLGFWCEPRGRTLVPFMLLIVGASIASPMVIPPAVIWAYGWAWTGHLGFERNRPATVRYPFWSLVADLRLFARAFGGRP